MNPKEVLDLLDEVENPPEDTAVPAADSIGNWLKQAQVDWVAPYRVELSLAMERIKQLEEIIQGAEFQYTSFGAKQCSWCGKTTDDSSDGAEHFDDCEAFTPEGGVR